MPRRRLDGLYPIAVDFDGNGTLKQIYRENQAVTALYLNQNAFEILEGALVQPELFANAQERVRETGKAGTNHSLDTFDFVIGDGNGFFMNSDELYDTRGNQDGKAAERIEAAENITRKKRALHFLGPVGPTAFHFIYGQKVGNIFIF